MLGHMRYADEQIRDARKRAFLDALAVTGTVTQACEAVGVSRKSFYNWKQDDKEFASYLKDAFAEASERLEQEARRRAVQGIEEPITNKDGFIWKRDPRTGDILLDDDFEPIPYTINKRSDRLLEVLLKGNHKKYRDAQAAVEVDMPDGGGGPDGAGRRITVRFIRSDGEGGVHPDDQELVDADRAERDEEG